MHRDGGVTALIPHSASGDYGDREQTRGISPRRGTMRAAKEVKEVIKHQHRRQYRLQVSEFPLPDASRAMSCSLLELSGVPPRLPEVVNMPHPMTLRLQCDVRRVTKMRKSCRERVGAGWPGSSTGHTVAQCNSRTFGGGARENTKPSCHCFVTVLDPRSTRGPGPRMLRSQRANASRLRQSVMRDCRCARLHIPAGRVFHVRGIAFKCVAGARGPGAFQALFH